MSAQLAKAIIYRVYVYRSPDEEGTYIAHCLELDLIGLGECVQTAITELLENMYTQTKVCARTGAQFFVPAPQEVWKKYGEALKSGRKVAQELIERAFDDFYKRLGHKPPTIDERIGASKQVPRELLGV